MTPKLILIQHTHATVPVPQFRAEGHKAFLPRETRRILRQRGNPLIPPRRTRGSMLGPFVNNLMFTPLSVLPRGRT